MKQNILPTAFVLALLALVAPLLLLPIEHLVPVGFLLEELLKGAFVLFLISKIDRKYQLKLVILVALIFSLSENLFFLSSFITKDILQFFPLRILLTTMLHIFTLLIILLPTRKNFVWFLPALALAVLLHFLFNKLIGGLL